MLNRKASSSFPGFLFIAMLLSLVLTTSALADSHARAVRLSFVEGDVQLDRRDGHGYDRAFLNMPIVQGTRLWTRGDARAEVEFEDGSTLRLVPDTLVEFEDLSLRSDGDKLSSIRLDEGTLYCNLKRDRDDTFHVFAAGRDVMLRSSSRFRVQLTRTDLAVAVFKGQTLISGAAAEQLEVRKGETLALALEDRSRYYLSRGVEDGRYDAWDQERDDIRDRYARAHRNEYPMAYGAYDLYSYGTYTVIPGYGQVWRPNIYDISWTPYSDGAWVYYPTYGYVWVSSYPWGWMPYRYGRWIYASGYGWCWSAGNGWNRWNSWSPATIVINSPIVIVRPRVNPRNAGGVVIVGNGPGTTQNIGPRLVSGSDGELGARGRVSSPGVRVDTAFAGTSGSGVTTTNAASGAIGRRPSRVIDDVSAIPAAGRIARDGATGATATSTTTSSVAGSTAGGTSADTNPRRPIRTTDGDDAKLGTASTQAGVASTSVSKAKVEGSGRIDRRGGDIETDSNGFSESASGGVMRGQGTPITPSTTQSPSTRDSVTTRDSGSYNGDTGRRGGRYDSPAEQPRRVERAPERAPERQRDYSPAREYRGGASIERSAPARMESAPARSAPAPSAPASTGGGGRRSGRD